MPKSTKKQLRALWLQVHKWIGLLLAVLIIPISVTGAALVWHDGLEAVLDPQRHEVLGPAALPPSAYAEAAPAMQSLRSPASNPLPQTLRNRATLRNCLARTTGW